MNDFAYSYFIMIILKNLLTNDFFFPQVTTVTKVVREVSHMEPDPGAVSYVSMPLMAQDYQHPVDPRGYAADPYMVNFDHYDPYLGYPPQPGYPGGPHGIYMNRTHSPPHSPSEHSRASPSHHGMRRFLFIFMMVFF